MLAAATVSLPNFPSASTSWVSMGVYKSFTACSGWERVVNCRAFLRLRLEGLTCLARLCGIGCGSVCCGSTLLDKLLELFGSAVCRIEPSTLLFVFVIILVLNLGNA